MVGLGDIGWKGIPAMPRNFVDRSWTLSRGSNLKKIQNNQKCHRKCPKRQKTHTIFCRLLRTASTVLQPGGGHDARRSRRHRQKTAPNGGLGGYSLHRKLFRQAAGQNKRKQEKRSFFSVFYYFTHGERTLRLWGACLSRVPSCSLVPFNINDS